MRRVFRTAHRSWELEPSTTRRADFGRRQRQQWKPIGMAHFRAEPTQLPDQCTELQRGRRCAGRGHVWARRRRALRRHELFHSKQATVLQFPELPPARPPVSRPDSPPDSADATAAANLARAQYVTIRRATHKHGAGTLVASVACRSECERQRHRHACRHRHRRSAHRDDQFRRHARAGHAGRLRHAYDRRYAPFQCRKLLRDQHRAGSWQQFEDRGGRIGDARRQWHRGDDTAAWPLRRRSLSDPDHDNGPERDIRWLDRERHFRRQHDFSTMRAAPPVWI